jgi:hypothetical protein
MTSSAMAEAFQSYRSATSNNIFQCSTNYLREARNGHGNIHSSSVNIDLLCLENNNQAKWVIFAGAVCEEGRCDNQEARTIMNNYMNPSFNSHTNTYDYKVSKAVVGVNCQVTENSHQEWSCNEIRYLQKFTLKTTGNTPLLPIGEYFRRYVYVPSYPGSIQGIEPSNYISCFGSPSFCH